MEFNGKKKLCILNQCPPLFPSAPEEFFGTFCLRVSSSFFLWVGLCFAPPVLGTPKYGELSGSGGLVSPMCFLRDQRANKEPVVGKETSGRNKEGSVFVRHGRGRTREGWSWYEAREMHTKILGQGGVNPQTQRFRNNTCKTQTQTAQTTQIIYKTTRK